MAKATNRADVAGSADDLAPTPPKALTIIYALFSLALLAAFAYTVWSNQNDPGRMFAWIVKGRMWLHGR